MDMLTKYDRSISPKDILALLTKMATMSNRQAQEFQRSLHEPARIYSFDCGELAETVENLQVYDATANAVETYLKRGSLYERNITFPVSIVKESDGIFEFTIQNLGRRECHLLTCHVTKKHQGQGKSKQMVQAIKDSCIDHWGYNKIYGRAGIARVDEGVVCKGDWRESFVEYKGEQMTALMRFWLKQEGVYPLKDFEKGAGKDEFVIIPNGIF